MEELCPPTGKMSWQRHTPMVIQGSALSDPSLQCTWLLRPPLTDEASFRYSCTECILLCRLIRLCTNSCHLLRSAPATNQNACCNRDKRLAVQLGIADCFSKLSSFELKEHYLYFELWFKPASVNMVQYTVGSDIVHHSPILYNKYQSKQGGVWIRSRCGCLTLRMAPRGKLSSSSAVAWNSCFASASMVILKS